MSGTDKAKNKAEELAGKAKEKVGQATGDKDLRPRARRPGEGRPQAGR